MAFLCSNSPAATWLTDLGSAQATAKAENKMVLLDFTGSDWCGWCIRLRNEVFSKPEFDAYANENLVLVEVDFPHGKAQSSAEKKANFELAKRFHIQGYPTIIVLNGDGKQIGHLSYQAGGPEPFIKELARISGDKVAPPAAAKHAKPQDDSPPPPLFNGAVGLPPPRFNDLVLKGLSGSKSGRLAMINNKMLGVGESVMMKLGDCEVNVKCVEIRQDLVVVSVDGAVLQEVRMRVALRAE